MYSMMVSVVRFSVMGMGLPWWTLIAISFSQGMVNGILLIEFVRYAARLAQEGIGEPGNILILHYRKQSQYHSVSVDRRIAA